MGEMQGGYVNTVVRVGETVRRPVPDDAEFVHALLLYLQERGWTGAPRFLGIDENDRQVLTYLPGWVAWLAPGRIDPPGVWSDRSLARIAELVRELHDLTAGSALAGSAEVVCHNDLASRNTVYRDSGDGSFQPVAFIDWDLAGPGSRIDDLACVCWQFVIGDADRPDPITTGKLLRLICDAYGLADRTALLPTMLACQDRNWRQIEARANAGDEASQRLRALGAVRTGKAAYGWTATHQHEIERALGLG
jgi:hypothetical protein